MSDKRGSEDEIQIIANKFRSVTTIEPMLNVPEQVKTLKINNSSTSCSLIDSKMNDVAEENSFTQNLLQLNLPEKILFVIDTVRDRSFTPFKHETEGEYTPLFMIKRAVECFICAKSTLQRCHEYALMVLNSQDAQWICDFTNSTKSIVNHLDTIDEDVLEEDQKMYDLGQLFEKIEARLPVPSKHYGTTVPTFVSRIIIIYARSNCVPKFYSSRSCMDDLTRNRYLFLDLLYVHDPPNSENMCEEIYTELASSVTTSLSYIFEVGRNAPKLHDNMAKLLAHPLQRPIQRNTSYAIFSSTALQEVNTSI